MKITLLYQVSHYIRVKKKKNIKSWDQQNYLVIRGFCYIRPLYNEVPLYLGSLYSICYVLYWTANFPSNIALLNCPQSQIIENIYVCERAERASFENLRNFFSLLCISLCTMIFERYSQNLWGPLFVGAPGQLPTLPSPKSGPDQGAGLAS